MAKNNDNQMKEIKRIKNLLILIALKSGATAEEVNYATGMGAANVSRLFPIKYGKRKPKKTE